MASRRCTLCGQQKDSGAGKTAFVCDACLGLKGRELTEVMRGFASAPEMTLFLSQQYRVPTIDLAKYEIAEDVRALVARSLCEQHVVIPVAQVHRSLIVAVTDPGDTAVLEALAKATGMTIEPVIASRDEIRAALRRYKT